MTHAVTDPLFEQLQQSLGPAFTLERELGGGGMSRVFVARDAALGRDVVVKVFAPEFAAELSADRFAQEIRLAAALQEPHIIPLLSAGATSAGLPWYTMPYVRGESLRARVTRGPVPADEAVAIIADVAKALAHAHAHGVVHRDIKPENILLSSGTAVVADFGIAKAFQRSRTATSGLRAPETPALTQLGTSIGTPAYMAPEQAAGDPSADHRADIYAWGVVAYEMLAGRHPFAGKTSPQALMAAHFSEVPASLPKSVPSSIAALVMCCLDKDPARRPAEAGDLLAALGAAATMTTSPWRRRRRSVVLGAIGLLAALGAGLAWSRTLRTPPVLSSVAVLPFVNVGGDAKEEYFSDGMTDELAHALATLPGVHVAGRSSSYAFKGRNVAAAEIGRALDVAGFVEGTVRRAGGRVRITAQLTSTRDGKVQWSDSYERASGDVFAMQDELTRAIVAAVTPTLRGSAPTTVVGEGPRGTSSADAYDLYLRGRYFWTRRGQENLLRAAGYFRSAIAADSVFARAWAGLAMTYSVFPNYASDPADTMPGLALAAATHAIALDSTLADANAAMANALSVSRRPLDADMWYRRALAIEPRNATAHQWRGEDQFVLGHADEAMSELRTATALDPLSGPAYTDLSIVLTAMRRFDEAIVTARRAVELGIANGYAAVGLAHFFAGRPDSAIVYLTRVPIAMGRPLNARAELALAYAAKGDWGKVDGIRAAIARKPATDPSGLDAALVALSEGDHAPLLRVLATPAGRRHWYVRFYSLGCYPFADPLKDEPAYTALLAQLQVMRCTGASPWPIKPRVR